MNRTQTGPLGVAAMVPVTWRISSFCAGNGECVAVAQLPTGIAVRDTKDPAGPALQFSKAEWLAFLAEARAGEFDR